MKTMIKKPNELTYFSLDVEAVGLHGEAFSFGYVVYDAAKKEVLEEGLYACDRTSARGTDSDREWINANVPVVASCCDSPKALRDLFWWIWSHWKNKGAYMLADCNWPVESNFLSACVKDMPEERTWGGPYPILDVGSAAALLGIDPTAVQDRLPNELPEHQPLNDSRQSLRMWLTLLDQINT